jgi:RimJ/RimL family protein N-acetyltransferase
MSPDLATVSWPLVTARLSIRPATKDDLEATWRFRRVPSVGQWLTRLPRARDEYAEQFLDPGRLAKTFVVERAGDVVGDLMFSVEDAWSQVEVAEQAQGVQAELGWVISPEHTRQGLATEAVAELMRFGFEELHLRRAFAQCFADNVASWRLMERLGMRREYHAVQESLHRTGEWIDGFRYAILADEWQAARGGSERGTEED